MFLLCIDESLGMHMSILYSGLREENPLYSRFAKYLERHKLYVKIYSRKRCNSSLITPQTSEECHTNTRKLVGLDGGTQMSCGWKICKFLVNDNFIDTIGKDI